MFTGAHTTKRENNATCENEPAGKSNAQVYACAQTVKFWRETRTITMDETKALQEGEEGGFGERGEAERETEGGDKEAVVEREGENQAAEDEGLSQPEKVTPLTGSVALRLV